MCQLLLNMLRKRRLSLSCWITVIKGNKMMFEVVLLVFLLCICGKLPIIHLTFISDSGFKIKKLARFSFFLVVWNIIEISFCENKKYEFFDHFYHFLWNYFRYTMVWYTFELIFIKNGKKWPEKIKKVFGSISYHQNTIWNTVGHLEIPEVRVRCSLLYLTRVRWSKCESGKPF